jgi:NAD-dependent deacetylase
MSFANISLSDTLIEQLHMVNHVVVFSGAGISAESGIPTFRDKLTGLWENYDAEELASATAFKNDPALVWGWYEWRRMMVQRAQPNPAHCAIAELAKRVKRLTVITQNVDDLHERAGSREYVVHLHGRLLHPFCFACRRPYSYQPGILEEPEGGRKIEPPRCGHCGGRIRPGVVWFGESLPDVEWKAAIQAVNDCQLFLCIGTSSLVRPASQLPQLAINRGAITVQINPNPTSLDNQVTLNFPGPAGVILPAFVQAVWGTASAPPQAAN